MCTRRVLAVVLGLGLVLGAFASVPGTASADDEAGTTVYFPWIPAGETIDGVGPWEGMISIQNLSSEDQASVNISVGVDSDGGMFEPRMNIMLPPNGSLTVTAEQLQIDEPGASVLVRSLGVGDDTALISAVAKSVASWQEASPPGQQDEQPELPVGRGQGQGPPEDRGRGRDSNGPGNGGSDLPSRPQLPDEVNPQAPVGSITSHIAVDGYTGLTEQQVTSDSDQYVVPNVQVVDDWTTTVRVANLSESGGGTFAVAMTFFPEDGDAIESGGTAAFSLSPGEVETVDAASYVDDGFDGWGLITSAGPIGAVSERVQSDSGALLTNVSNASENGDETEFASMLFQDSGDWDSQLKVVNPAETSSAVTVTFYGPDGPPALMELTDMIPGLGAATFEVPDDENNGATTAVIVGTPPLHATVDHIRPAGDSVGPGDAMTYGTVGSSAQAGDRLALPLFEKENPATDESATSGLHLFNPSSSASVTLEISFYDATGSALPVSPEADAIPMHLEPLESDAIFASDLGDLPAGLHGTAVVEVVEGAGEIVGVSSNVDAGEDRDSAVAYNLTRVVEDVDPVPTTLEVEPIESQNMVGESHEITATVHDQFGTPLEGVGVSAFVSDGPNTEIGLEPAEAVTDSSGQVSLSYSSTSTGEDTILVGVAGSDLEETVTKQWTAPDVASIIVEPAVSENLVGNTHEIVVTAVGDFEQPVEGAAVQAQVLEGPHVGATLQPDPAITDADGEARLAYTGDAAGTDMIDVTVLGTDITDSVTKTWVVPDAEPTFISVTPVSSTNVVGDLHEVTVEVLDQFGEPFEGAAISGIITEGPHSDPTPEFFATTDEDGIATFGYTGEQTGTDELRFWVAGTDPVLEQFVTKTWVVGDPQ